MVIPTLMSSEAGSILRNGYEASRHGELEGLRVCSNQEHVLRLFLPNEPRRLWGQLWRAAGCGIFPFCNGDFQSLDST